MSLTKSYLINGPNNVVRLTNGKKILYIFGDYHLQAHMQNECVMNDNYESMDIDKFLSMFMKLNKEKQFDLFTEMYQKDLFPSMYNYRSRYIDAITKLFKTRLVKQKDEIKINPKYPNIRFHFMDIRYGIIFFSRIFYFVDDYFRNRYINDLDEYTFFLTELRELAKVTFNSIQSKDNKYINKVLNKYSDEGIKKKINLIYQDIFVKNFNLLFEYIEQVLNIVKGIKSSGQHDDKIIMKINELIDKIDILCKDSFTVLTDLYFIRRFLDKNYITNTILYTGLAHLSDITYLLVNYFDFKISDIYYLPENYHLDKEIKKYKTENYDYISSLSNNLTFKLPDGMPYQCVNLFDFPVDFS